MLTADGGLRINQHGVVTPSPALTEVRTPLDHSMPLTPQVRPAILGLSSSTDLTPLKFNCTIQTQHSTSGASGTQTISNFPEQPKETSPIDKQDLIAQYPECFNGIGKFQGEHHITLDPSAPAVVHTPGRVSIQMPAPVLMPDDIKNDTDDIINKGIITEIEEGEPT